MIREYGDYPTFADLFTMNREKIVLIYSGGMDSFTLLNWLRSTRPNADLYPLTFDYGQRHKKEIRYAQDVCNKLALPHKVVDISAIHQLINQSTLTGAGPIPEGHYADENMKSTVVPNRNMVLLSLAIAYAANIGASQVFYGAHGGDHHIYPDCRPEFVAKMNAVSAIANYDPVSIETPFLHKTKGEILAIGLAMNLDYSLSWTCYNGGDLACGHCGACVERLEAFAENNARDPLTYVG